MGKLSVALERGVIIAAAVSTVSASAQSVAPASKYPVKLAGGFQVHRGSEPGAESCIVYGLRAMPTAGEKTGPLFVSAKVIWDEKGESSGYGALSVEPIESSVTNSQERSVEVRLDVDGRLVDVPYGEVHKAIVTFLTMRFPMETFNKILNGRSLKVSLVDAQTKEAKLFATADISSGSEAFSEFGRCIAALPDLPTQVGKGWELTRNTDGCMMTSEGLAVARDDHGAAAIAFSEDEPHDFTKATRMTIAGRTVKFDYGRTGRGNHIFKFSAEDLDRLRPDAKLEISDGAEPILTGANIFPPAGLFYLKKCAAPLQKPARRPSK